MIEDRVQSTVMQEKHKAYRCMCKHNKGTQLEYIIEVETEVKETDQDCSVSPVDYGIGLSSPLPVNINWQSKKIISIKSRSQ